MQGSVSLQQRLEGHVPSPSSRRVTRSSFRRPGGGLRRRIDASLDEAVRIFELDRLLYDIEVDAQHAWLRRLMAFDAYCARRDAGGAPDGPVR
ncbi:MAG TPA: hypothetical protein VE824_05360 [Gaiellales bacterium]|nr:hypothetical protein [Gaiellales bacterium]